MASRCQRAPAIALTMACAVIAQAAVAHARPLHLTISVQDYAGLSPAVITQTEAVVARIYHQIGVDIVWLDVARVAPTMLSDRAAPAVDWESVIHVGLLSAAMEHKLRPDRGTVGVAITGSHLVRIFVSRVEYLASNSQQDLADVLGHVMAHEIGHLLLGPNAHSTAGLMAAVLDVPRIGLGGLSFDRRQAAVIRTKLAGDIGNLALR